MCGICGFVSWENPVVSQIMSMCDTLSHRGPDDQGAKIFHAHGATIGLGHRRLSIIDLSETGHQPMTDEAGDIWIVYNGEVYNFLALRRNLVEKGYRFVGSSDTEVILYAYKEWGLDCLQRFSGMFSLAIYDQSLHRLMLARDRIGIKPLYFYRNGKEIAFASELKALLKYDGFRKEINLDSLYQYLSFQYVPAPRSIFANTFKLEPGCYLSLDVATGDSQLGRYWNLLEIAQPNKDFQPKDEKKYLEAIDELLRSSISGHMISDVPVGAFLSGGIDSSLVVAMMAHYSTNPVKTFTIGFHEKHRNEAPFAKKIAEYLQTEHYEYYVEPQDIFQIIPKLLDYYDEPFGDSSALPTFLVSKFARQEVKVILSGDGGDELFGGYTRYGRVSRAAKIDKFLPSSMRRRVLGLLRYLPIDHLQRIAAGMQYNDPIELFHFLLAMWKGGDLNRLVDQQYDFRDTKFYTTWHTTGSQNLLNRMMQVDLRTYLPDDGLTKVDRASMAHSLEVRVPLLDHHIVEFALNLPVEYKIKNGEQKYLLKQLLARYLPGELYKRPKTGFMMPLNNWLRNDLYFLIDVYLNPSRIKQRGLLNVDFLDEIIQKHMSGRYDYFYMLWSVIILELWFEKWID